MPWFFPLFLNSSSLKRLEYTHFSWTQVKGQAERAERWEEQEAEAARRQEGKEGEEHRRQEGPHSAGQASQVRK